MRLSGTTSLLVIASLTCGVLAQPGQDATDGGGQPDAQPNTRDPSQRIDHARVVELIEELGSEDWATRQRAEQFLLLTPSSELPFIERRLADENLSAEQHMRLGRVGGRVFRRVPHAAMGIRFLSSVPTDPPVISMPLPDFDARRVIQPGDLVTKISGMRIENVADLRAAIISHKPNVLVEVHVERQGREVAVSFRLGAWSDLNGQRMSDTDTDAAWEWRINRAAIMGGGPETESPIIPPIEHGGGAGEVPSPSNSVSISPTVYQFGAVVAVAAGQPLATAAGSPYNPNTTAVIQSNARRRTGGGQDRNRDQIILFQTQIESNRREISFQETRIRAIDASLKSPHPEKEQEKLAKLRIEAAQRITELKIESARLSQFLVRLRQ